MKTPVPANVSRHSSFQTTRWSLVLSAGQGWTAASRDALSALCQMYWYPLYAYVRRKGVAADTAQDLTQDFFVRLLEKNVLAKAAPERGRFRAFLLASMKNFLANQRDHEQALKRGGDRLHLSLDWQSGESRLSLQPVHELTPERLFEREWAVTLLERVIQRLRDEFEHVKKSDQFEVLKETLTSDRAGLPYDEIAARLAISADAARQAVHRVRRRYRELLREEIAQTVADPAEIDDEIRSLIATLGS